MPRLTADAWARARIEWEADPRATYESVARGLGVSRVAVTKHALKHGWERVQSLASIAAAAQRKADAKVAPQLSGGDKVAAEVAQEAAKRLSAEAAVDVRADVIDRHRSDWAEHRRLFTLGAIAADFELGKSAKISAEMLQIRQRGEQAAYGLDQYTPRDDRNGAPSPGDIPPGAEIDAYRTWVNA